jgi:hypothetical protein
LLDLGEGQAGQLHDLVAAAMPRDDSHGIAPHTERVREKVDEGLVCATLLGGGRHPHLPCVAVAADDLGAARAGADTQPDAGRDERHALECMSHAVCRR